jgi:hypothetical protein
MAIPDFKVTLTMNRDVDTLHMQFDVRDDSIATAVLQISG